MIKFRGEILFRVGVKKEESTSTLLVMTFDASKMGIDKAVVAIRSKQNERKKLDLYEVEGLSAQSPCRVHLYTIKCGALVGNYTVSVSSCISAAML